MKAKALILCTVVLAACHTTRMMTETDVQRGSTKYPGLTMAQLQQGKADYEQYCSTCHGLKKPTSESAAEWEHIVPDMARRAAKKAGKEVIDANAQLSILRYLTTMAKK